MARFAVVQDGPFAETKEQLLRDHMSAEQKAASPFSPGFRDRHGWGFGGAVATSRGGGSGHPGSYGWMGGFGTSLLIAPPPRGR